MTPAFEASLVLNILSLVAWASLLLCLVRMRFCWENTLSQLAVWRGNVRAICDSLMRSGSSSLWCFVRSSHSPCILLTRYLAAFTMVLAYCHCWLTLSLDRSGCDVWCLLVYKVKEFVYCVGVSKYAIVGKGVGFCDVWILVCFDCVVTGALNKAVSFLWPVSSLKTFLVAY